MNLKYFIAQLRRNWLLLILLPIITGVCVYIFSPKNVNEYTSNTTIYTGIQSGYNLEDNLPESTKSSNGSTSANAFSNMLALLNSRELKETVFIRLISSHLFLKEPDPALISKETYDRLQTLVPTELRNQLVGQTLEETNQRVSKYYKQDTKNALYSLFHSEDPTYSEVALSTVTGKRLGESDLVQIEYVSNDPGVCKTTLELITNGFIEDYKELFSSQNASVIGYFDEATQKAQDKLQAAENKLLEFHKRNGIADLEGQISAATSDKQEALALYNDLEVQYAGALSAMQQMEQNLRKRGVSNLRSQEIIRLRNQLSKNSSQITELEMSNDNSSSANSRLERLRAESERISSSIKETINNSLPGLSMSSLLDEYMKQTVLVGELKSKIALMRNQKNDVEGQYGKLVPLGAEVRRLRREIEVAEKEYLAQVEGLKQSQLTKQNIELTSQVKVVDPPFFPSAPKDYKLILLVVGGAVGALFVVIAIILAMTMMNTTLKEPIYAALVTNFPVFGILPKANAGNSKQLSETNRAEEHLARQLLLKYYQKKEKKVPYVVGILSGQNGEGKSQVCTSLANKLEGMGIKTLVALPEDHIRLLNENDNTTAYSSLKGVTQSVSISDLTGASISEYGIVLIEFPAVLENAYPVSLFQYLDLALIVAKANRAWEQADKAVFKNIQEIVDAPMEVVLTDVETEFLHEFVGTRLKQNNKPKLNQISTSERLRIEEKHPQEI